MALERRHRRCRDAQTGSRQLACAPLVLRVALVIRLPGALRGSKRAVADRFEDPRPANARGRARLVGTEAKPRDAAACYVRFNRIHGGATLRSAAFRRAQSDTPTERGL